MEKTFFGESGLTNTSANYIANKAKEFITSLTTEEFNLYNTDLKLLTNGDYAACGQGVSNSELASFKENLNKISQATSLIAWLREAIRTKDLESQRIQGLNLDEYCAIVGKSIPSYAQFDEYTLQDAINEMSIKDRYEYFKLQTYAAVYGKFIHPDGPFEKARKQLQRKLKTPIEVTGSGQDIILYRYTPSVSTELVEQTYFDIQNKQREYQASYNKILSTLENKVNVKKSETIEARRKNNAEYNKAVRELNLEIEQYKLQEMTQLNNLKILIPDNLKKIYLEISKLGKTDPA